ncbi:flagellar basal-body MS-ring/collar protein FliF [Oceanimonas baumannii]|uniref:Flagellar M-ring protein n=1 Tax=Oceanimonas baumannii TaxID=129578 RepID=A0A235CN13_9GAMM|nr:flagellar basal-body MS-ring/collar protein FliF [Oceanimonas baumannii]OYD25774.1 flagellar M-ring protein FliF [Oceanimonas baumannii]TDW60219.1 flagellar M-ring protein FliF [Oceanimonas baumannii]
MAQASALMSAGQPLKAGFGKVREYWLGMSAHHRQVMLLGSLAVIIAAAVVMFLWQAGRSFVPLYGKQELYDQSRIVEVLEQEQIPFRLDPNSGQILVEETQLGPVRMRLASQGVRAVLPAGMDELAQGSGFGTSQFMETRRYRHALEGELSRTIMALDWVRQARVHLAMPERTLFIGRAEQTPTASVMLDVVPGQEPDPAQVEGIVNLVSGSVPGMTRKNVSVIDQRGQVLSDELAVNGQSRGLSLRQMEYTRQLEQQLAQRARDMLYPVLGASNFRVQVTASLDFNAVEETRESLDQTPVLLRETSSENLTQNRLELGIPGALSNTPPQTDADGENTEPKDNQSQHEQREYQRQFESGRSVVHTRYQSGRINQLSVSVLLNNSAAPEGGWDPQQLTQLGQMVQGAVGFSPSRGDSFALSSFDFAPATVLAEFPEPLAWWQQPETQTYARYLLGAFMVLAVLLLGVRPLVRHLGTNQQAAAMRELQAALPAATEDEAALARLGRTEEGERAGPHTTLPWEADELEWQLPPPGSELKVQVTHLQLLAERETDRVAEVIKHWIKDHD